jgi:microcystin degradation protein MlrC
MTYTFATMAVSGAAFDEIKAKLIEAGYGHAIRDDGVTLDMHGIALVVEEAGDPKVQFG